MVAMFSKILNPILNRLGYVHKSQLEQPKQPSKEDAWRNALQIKHSLFFVMTDALSMFVLDDENRSLSKREVAKLSSLILNIHKTASRHTSTVRLPSDLDDMQWIESIHPGAKKELLKEIQSLSTRSLRGMDAEKLWCRVLINEVRYQVFGLLNVPPFMPNDMLINSVSDFNNPRKIKYTISGKERSFPFELFPMAELSRRFPLVNRNGEQVSIEDLFKLG